MAKTPALVLSFLLIFLAASQGFAAPEVATYDGLLQAIREVRTASEARVTAAVEKEKVREAWETGKLIDEHILHHKQRANYGEQVIIKLAKDLGSSETELKYMLQFARTYPIRPLTDELPWGHYRELLSLNDTKQRTEIATEASQKRWTQKELREEIKRRKFSAAEDSPAKLPEITPGPLNTYQIIRLKGRLKIDLGFGVTMAQRVRVRRIDAPEVLSAEGKEAKAYLEKILSRDLDQHGRPIADVWVKGKSVDQELLDQELAVRMSE